MDIKHKTTAAPSLPSRTHQNLDAPIPNRPPSLSICTHQHASISPNCSKVVFKFASDEQGLQRTYEVERVWG